MQKEEIKTKKDLGSSKETSELIEEIIKKHGFWEKEETEFEKFLLDPTENIGFIENSPSYKLSNLVKKYTEAEISLKKIPLFLEKELNISKEKAKEINEELEEKILRFIKPEKTFPEMPAEQSQPSNELKPQKFPRKDIYKEPVE